MKDLLASITEDLKLQFQRTNTWTQPLNSQQTDMLTAIGDVGFSPRLLKKLDKLLVISRARNRAHDVY
jgi:hypothetical protein